MGMSCKHHKWGVPIRGLLICLGALLLFAVPSLGGETKESKRCLKRGLKLEKKGQFEQAFEEYGKAIELDPELERAWYQRGVLFFRSDRFEEAKADLTRAIELKPDYGSALYARGVANRYLMDLDQAESDLTEAAEFYPDSLLIFVERAYVRTLQKEY